MKGQILFFLMAFAMYVTFGLDMSLKMILGVILPLRACNPILPLTF
jgi:hypothetical protein